MVKKTSYVICLLIGLILLFIAFKVVIHVMNYYPKLAVKLGRPLPVETARVEYGDLPLTIWGSGILEPRQTINYFVDIAGHVRKVYVKEGDLVRKGDILVKLDDAIYAAEVESCRKQLLKASRDLELFLATVEQSKYKVVEELKIKEMELSKAKKSLMLARKDLLDGEKLFAKKMIAEKELEDRRITVEGKEIALKNAELDWKMAKEDYVNFERSTAMQRADKEAALAQAKEELVKAEHDLAQTVVRAITAGIIGKVFVDEGELLQEKQQLLTLKQINPIVAKLLIAQEMSMFVSRDQKVRIVVHTWPRLEVDGRVETIGSAIDDESHALPVWVVLENQGLRLKPGVSVEGFVKRTLRGVLVPEIALLGPATDHYVFLVQGDRAYIQRVKIIARNGVKALVAEGLKPGDMVVVAGQLYLNHGMKVNVHEQRQ
jgi:membrane fusion protein (multidrug efflux system)